MRFHSLSISPVHLSSLEAIKPMSRCIAYLMIKHLSDAARKPEDFVAYIIIITSLGSFFLNGRRVKWLLLGLLEAL